jgi:hypothetical protein
MRHFPLLPRRHLLDSPVVGSPNCQASRNYRPSSYP